MGVLLWWSCQSPFARSHGLLNHLNSFHGGMFKLNAKFDADSLLYSLSHFECNSHTVQVLTQWHLLPPLTSTVKSSLFTHVPSSPLSLAARLHWCHANHSCYNNNGWTFSGQTSYMFYLSYLNGTCPTGYYLLNLCLLNLLTFTYPLVFLSPIAQFTVIKQDSKHMLQTMYFFI